MNESTEQTNNLNNDQAFFPSSANINSLLNFTSFDESEGVNKRIFGVNALSEDVSRWNLTRTNSSNHTKSPKTKLVNLPNERTMNWVFGVSLGITFPIFFVLLVSTVQRAFTFFTRDISAELLAQYRFEQFKGLVLQSEHYYGFYLYPESLQAIEAAEKRSQYVVINEENAYLFRALYNMKGDIMQMEEKYPEAEKYFNMTMEIVNRYYPDHTYYTIQSQTNLGELYWRQGKYEESKRILLHCLKLRENLDYKVIFGHLQLSSLYTEWGKSDKAKEHLMKVFTSLEELPETDKLFYQGRYYRNLGKIQLKEGDIENAKESYRNAFGLFEKALPKKNDLILIYKKEYEKNFNETYTFKMKANLTWTNNERIIRTPFHICKI